MKMEGVLGPVRDRKLEPVRNRAKIDAQRVGNVPGIVPGTRVEASGLGNEAAVDGAPCGSRRTLVF